MVGKYFEGSAPSADKALASKTIDAARSDKGMPSSGFTLDLDVGEQVKQYGLLGSKLSLGPQAAAGLAIVQSVDLYIEETSPFRLAKDPDRLPEVGTILFNCAEALRIASVLLWPFIPDKCEAFWRRIGFGHYAEQLKDNGTGDLEAWVKWGQLEPGTPIEKGDPLFPRYQVEKKP